MIQNIIKYNVIFSNIIVWTEIYIGENTSKLKWRQKIVSEQILKLFDWSQIFNKILPDESKFTSLPGLGPTSMDTIGKSLRKSHSFVTPQESQDAIMWSFKVYKKEMCVHIHYIYTKICSNSHTTEICVTVLLNPWEYSSLN